MTAREGKFGDGKTGDPAAAAILERIRAMTTAWVTEGDTDKARATIRLVTPEFNLTEAMASRMLNNLVQLLAVAVEVDPVEVLQSLIAQGLFGLDAKTVDV